MLLAFALVALLASSPVARQHSSRTRAASSQAAGGWQSLPIAARGPISRLLGARDGAFAVHGLRAVNPAQHIRVSFAARGASVAAGAATLDIAPVSYGRERAIHALGTTRPQVEDNRVSYAFGSLTESFANGPLGLEQSFEIASRPRGLGALSIRVRLGGLTARLQNGAVLLTGHGAKLRYDDLVVTDASGRTLPASFARVAGGVAIRVDDRGARYPLHVDPLVQQAVLQQPGENPDGGFGNAIAISKSTIAVGDPYYEDSTGIVYVFEEPAGGWAKATAPVASLQASGHAKEEDFGTSVALYENESVVPARNELVVGADDHLPSGAAFVFTAPSESKWAQAKQVAQLGGPAGDNLLGVSVAISGKTIVVGASGLSENLGALFVYEEPTNGWESTGTYAAKLHGPTPKQSKDGEECPQLGDAVAVTEHASTITVLGGSPGVYDGPSTQYNQCTTQLAGSAEVFTANVGEWGGEREYAPTLTLAAPQSETGNWFGYAVGLSEDGSLALVSAPTESPSVRDSGAAYVFTRPAGGWSGTPAAATLTSPHPYEDADFGFGAAISANGSKVVVGQPSFNPNAKENGHDFVYERSGAGGWASTNDANEVLTANYEEHLNLDGREIAIEGGTVVVDANGAAIVYGGGPGVEIESPANGGEYALGQTVLAAYKCVPPADATVTKCEGTVPSGSAIDTAAEGVHAFTVTAEDSTGATISRTSVYLVKPSGGSGSQPVSKEGSQQTTKTLTPEEIAAQEAAHKAQLQKEIKEFSEYVLYILEHPAPLGLCFNENGFQEHASVVPVSAWISAHGVAGASSAGAAAVASATKPGKATRPKTVTVFSRTLEVKPGKVSFKVPFTKAGRALAKRDLAEHRPLRIDWTITIRPAGLPTITRTFVVTLKAGSTHSKSANGKR